VVALAFSIVTAFLLIIYDRMIARRQETMNNAIRTGNLVHVPRNVRDRLMEDALQDEGKTSAFDANAIVFGGCECFKKTPHDFFPEATIMFADISGFSWASTENL
jgi:hypothetical protein